MNRLLATATVLGILSISQPALAVDFTQVSFTGDDFDLGYHVWACGEVSYPSDGINREMKLQGGSGDGDMYVCSGHMSSQDCYNQVVAGNHVCSSTSNGNNEDCSSSVTSGNSYTLCIYAYSAVSNITANVGYEMSGSSSTSSGAEAGATNYYMDCFKDNLFLGIAYHRACCLSSWDGSTGKVVSDIDYDGFSNGNYCRRGEHWKNGPESHDTTYTGESVSLGSSYSSAKSKMDSCGSATNSQYGTPNYARRSNTCSYNILFDCNSDCWIKAFTDCVDGSSGSGIAIRSPCW